MSFANIIAYWSLFFQRSCEFFELSGLLRHRLGGFELLGLFRHPSDGGDLFGLSHQRRATTDEQKTANAASIINIAMQFRLVMFAAIASRANFLN